MDESTRASAPYSFWLNLALNPLITPSLFRQLKAQYPAPSALKQALLNTIDSAEHSAKTLQLKQAMQQPISAKTATAIDQAVNWYESSPHHHLLGLDNPAYPALLRTTANAPPLLYVCGNLTCLNTPAVAIVGSRKATHAALEHARHIAQQLSEAGITVVSGMALGIDAAAHNGALTGVGQTVAVAATGMDRVYPKRHGKLKADIASNGAVITEFPLHNPLQPHCFPRRNRIISGMSLGVLVVEAALPSGTLTTAQHALRQGREVMAIPGSINNPLTRGCHELLRSGAVLVETANDVIACLGMELKRHCADNNAPERPLSSKNLTIDQPDTLTLLDCLGYDPVSIDTLIQRSGLDSARVSGALTHLALSGVIVADHAGRYSRCKTTGTTAASDCDALSARRHELTRLKETENSDS